LYRVVAVIASSPEVCVHTLLVNSRKCAGNTFLTVESTSPVKPQKWGGSATVLPELFEFCYWMQFIHSNVSILK
jgi:hypothetical protein